MFNCYRSAISFVLKTIAARVTAARRNNFERDLRAYNFHSPAQNFVRGKYTTGYVNKSLKKHPPVYHSLSLRGYNFVLKRRQTRGLRDDGGNCPTAVEATPRARATTLQREDLTTHHYMAQQNVPTHNTPYTGIVSLSNFHSLFERRDRTSDHFRNAFFYKYD